VGWRRSGRRGRKPEGKVVDKDFDLSRLDRMVTEGDGPDLKGRPLGEEVTIACRREGVGQLG